MITVVAVLVSGCTHRCCCCWNRASSNRMTLDADGLANARGVALPRGTPRTSGSSSAGAMRRLSFGNPSRFANTAEGIIRAPGENME